MSDSMDYYVRKCEKVILLVELAKNRLLARGLKLFNPAQYLRFRQKAMGEGLKTGNRG
jgi:hypothetical protein